MRRGYKTTEFYVTLVPVALNAILASGMIKDMPDIVRVVTAILAALTALGYTAARTAAKK